MEIYDEVEGSLTSVQREAIEIAHAHLRFRGKIFVGGLNIGKSYLYEHIVQQVEKETSTSDFLDAVLYAVAKTQEEN